MLRSLVGSEMCIRDSHQGAERFHPLDPAGMLLLRANESDRSWLHRYLSPFGIRDGLAGISQETVQFHYVTEAHDGLFECVKWMGEVPRHGVAARTRRRRANPGSLLGLQSGDPFSSDEE
eukprot:TRINITY_DN11560_c0_g1_i1.p1 TRINITY_DN11560_c0_g1~~TRINITY_DN11560_c0_g1_i1.p1  ORF type:complete len:120 (-),score=28.72 TRINITY_DN11560_c0_g1_i1:290-649(-)